MTQEYFFLFHLGYPFTWTTFFHFYQAIIPLCFIVLNPLIQWWTCRPVHLAEQSNGLRSMMV